MATEEFNDWYGDNAMELAKQFAFKYKIDYLQFVDENPQFDGDFLEFCENTPEIEEEWSDYLMGKYKDHHSDLIDDAMMWKGLI